MQILTKIRLFFRHYSRLDLINWFSIILLIALMLITFQYVTGHVFAWGLFLGSFFWLAVLHYEITSTEAVLKKKYAEFEGQGLSAKFQAFIKKSELELWGYWTILLFTDWFGLFWGTIALGLVGLGKFLVVPFFVISLAGIGATMAYFLIYLYRARALS